MAVIGVALFAAILMQQPLTLPQQAAGAETQGTAELRGLVMDRASRQPIAGATVSLSAKGANASDAFKVTTDNSGRFVFTRLPAGQYNLSVARAGVVTSAFGTPARLVTPTLSDGAHLNLPDLEISTGVEITGTILDDDGKPLQGATVSAWRNVYITPGERRLNFEGQATSDEIGDYRISGLKAGTYFVDAKASESIAPTFFPATATATMASPITITADVGAGTISIRLLSTPLARVSGAILNAQGLPSSDFYVLLAPLRDDGAQTASARLSSEVDIAGKFAIEKVPPGNYAVVVAAKSRLEAIGQTGRPAAGVDGAESGSIEVTVDGRDVDELLIHTRPPTLVSGKVTLDGVSIAAQLAKRLTLRALENSGPGGMSSILNATYATPASDGTFVMPVIPGGRLLRVFDLPAEVVLRRVLVRGADVTDEGFDVDGSQISDVVIELTSKPTNIAGRIVDDRGAPQKGAGVIVFSEDPRSWRLVLTRVVTAMRSSADGAFSFKGLPPGSYYAVAVPVLVDGEWAEPANLERLRAKATAFKLGDGERRDLALTIRK